jgi:hypothetical protein
MEKEGEKMSESRPTKRKIEFIESYWTGGEFGSDYQWNDNHGELIRCKDCKHARQMCQPWNDIVCEKNGQVNTPDWFCADGERNSKTTEVIIGQTHKK